MPKLIWRLLGLICVGLAYVGIIVPGMPSVTFAALALYCFARSSTRLHDWLWNHKHLGVHLRNWHEKRIYPTKAKYAMLLCCLLSLAWCLYIQLNPWAITGIAVFMAGWLIWAWRFPGSEAEYQRSTPIPKKENVP